ncbi:hypothetical protein GCM10007860_26660 [Chitiniphilus shinanonensis]|uniref:DUF5610 domain-containing protein n=1 Tax=Chitiniphilus shinanonensis TaxID=553088 RepID=A0ABQ6BZ46_9NEIS|nr:hypothetical protein [Chitiniphilus shinanonensis]GLS05512.1 hypothetical protein GCM10007860_26660 [Chitiniphilus shinanonensis]
MANGISSVGGQSTYSGAATKTGKTSEAKGESTQAQGAATVQEKVSVGNAKASELTYDNPRARLAKERPDLAQLVDESERKVGQLSELLRGSLGKQGWAASMAASGQWVQIDDKTRADAQAAISEDGEWGVKKVSERILAFAEYAIGGDPEKIDKIRAAVQKGFDDAKEILGGSLPDVSMKTYDAIMAKFDSWKKDGLPGSAKAEQSGSDNKV